MFYNYFKSWDLAAIIQAIIIFSLVIRGLLWLYIEYYSNNNMINKIAKRSCLCICLILMNIYKK